MDLETDEVAVCDGCGAGVQADTNPHLTSFRPWVGRDGLLQLLCGARRERRRGEHGEDTIAGGLDLVPAPSGDGSAHQGEMVGDDAGEARSQAHRQFGRPLDVGEEERDRSGR